MYFTDRGIEELAERRGGEEISLGWLAERLREFVDTAPSSRPRSTGSRRGSPAWTTKTDARASRHGHSRHTGGLRPVAAASLAIHLDFQATRHIVLESSA